VYDASSKEVHLTYIDGDSCGQPGKRWHTKIRFVCKEINWKGFPRLVKIDTANCEYEFEWYTNVICSATFMAPPGDCIFTDEQTKVSFNLGVLQSNYNPVSFNGNKFYFNLCGSVNATTRGCESAPFCRHPLSSSSSGTDDTREYRFVRLTLESGDLKLLYTRDDPNCVSQDHAILFICCDETANANSQPELEHESSCAVHLLWKTPLICSAFCAGGLKCQNTVVATSTTTGAPDGSLSAADNSGDTSGRHTLATTVGIIIVVVAGIFIAVGILAVIKVPRRRRAIASCLRFYFLRMVFIRNS